MATEKVILNYYKDRTWPQPLPPNPKFIDWLQDLPARGVRSVIDLGCGDAGWAGRCRPILDGRVAYQGVDIVSPLIEHNRRIYPWFSGEAKSVEELTRFEAEMVVAMDLFQFRCNGFAIQTLKFINLSGWKYFVVTTDVKANNKRRNYHHFDSINIEAANEIKAEVKFRFSRPGGEIIIYERDHE